MEIPTGFFYSALKVVDKTTLLCYNYYTIKKTKNQKIKEKKNGRKYF